MTFIIILIYANIEVCRYHLHFFIVNMLIMLYL